MSNKLVIAATEPMQAVYKQTATLLGTNVSAMLRLAVIGVIRMKKASAEVALDNVNKIDAMQKEMEAIGKKFEKNLPEEKILEYRTKAEKELAEWTAVSEAMEKATS